LTSFVPDFRTRAILAMPGNLSRPSRKAPTAVRPTRVTATMTYDLPVGKGRLVNLQSRWLNLVAGGWKIASTYIYQAGGPIVWNNADYVYYGGDLKVNPRNVDGLSFDKSLIDTASANQFQFHVRTFSSTYSNLRTDGINNLDTSLMKNFRLSERGANLQLKADAFNAVNHPVFGAPNVTPTNTAFGTITTQANRPRLMQISAKISF
jgi:hypothetical protein